MNFLPQFRAGAGSFLCWKFAFLKYHRFETPLKILKTGSSIKGRVLNTPLLLFQENLQNPMGSTIYYERKIFWKANVSYPLICACTCVYQGVRNVNFSGNFTYLLNGWFLFSLPLSLYPYIPETQTEM